MKVCSHAYLSKQVQSSFIKFHLLEAVYRPVLVASYLHKRSPEQLHMYIFWLLRFLELIQPINKHTLRSAVLRLEVYVISVRVV